MSVLVRNVEGPDDMKLAVQIRFKVFVDEQKVPAEEELDAHDATATHVLAVQDGRAIGTARLLEVDGRAKIGRVAVLLEARGTGAGRLLMDRLEEIAVGRGLREAVLDAQVSVMPFYAKRGYEPIGDVFQDAGIPHRRMVRALP